MTYRNYKRRGVGREVRRAERRIACEATQSINTRLGLYSDKGVLAPPVLRLIKLRLKQDVIEAWSYCSMGMLAWAVVPEGAAGREGAILPGVPVIQWSLAAVGFKAAFYGSACLRTELPGVPSCLSFGWGLW